MLLKKFLLEKQNIMEVCKLRSTNIKKKFNKFSVLLNVILIAIMAIGVLFSYLRNKNQKSKRQLISKVLKK